MCRSRFHTLRRRVAPTQQPPAPPRDFSRRRILIQYIFKLHKSSFISLTASVYSLYLPAIARFQTPQTYSARGWRGLSGDSPRRSRPFLESGSPSPRQQGNSERCKKMHNCMRHFRSPRGGPGRLRSKDWWRSRCSCRRSRRRLKPATWFRPAFRAPGGRAITRHKGPAVSVGPLGRL